MCLAPASDAVHLPLQELPSRGTIYHLPASSLIRPRLLSQSSPPARHLRLSAIVWLHSCLHSSPPQPSSHTTPHQHRRKRMSPFPLICPFVSFGIVTILPIPSRHPPTALQITNTCSCPSCQSMPYRPPQEICHQAELPPFISTREALVIAAERDRTADKRGLIHVVQQASNYSLRACALFPTSSSCSVPLTTRGLFDCQLVLVQRPSLRFCGKLSSTRGETG